MSTTHEYVIAECPKCGAEHVDFDGFGVLYCELCGYCAHVSAEGEPPVCLFCGTNVNSI